MADSWHVRRGTVVVIAVALVSALGVACKPKEEAKQQGDLIRGRATPAPAAAGAATAAPQQPGAGAAQAPQETPKFSFTECPPELGPKQTPANVSVVVSVPKTTFARNETVPIKLELKNNGSEGVRRRWSRNQPDYEIFVLKDGKTAWRHFAGADTRGSSGDRTYAPGEGRTIEEKWENVYCWNDGISRLDRGPGAYVVRGYFADFDGAWYSNEVRITIQP